MRLNNSVEQLQLSNLKESLKEMMVASRKILTITKEDLITIIEEDLTTTKEVKTENSNQTQMKKF